jgi:hypothetical protein
MSAPYLTAATLVLMALMMVVSASQHLTSSASVAHDG